MQRRTAIGALCISIAAGCGYPTFSYGPGSGGNASSSSTTSPPLGGAGGMATTTASTGGESAGGASSSSTSASSTASSASSSASSSSSTSGMLGPCGINHLLISEVRSRGLGGGSDEFIEIYNPTPSPIVLDSTWTLQARTADLAVTDYTVRWTGKGKTIPAHGHFLVGGATYVDGPPRDDALTVPITDAASVVLARNNLVIDALCYYVTGAQLTDLLTPFPVTFNPFYCNGLPIASPHDDTTATNKDISLERRPGGGAGNCVNSGDNSDDFVTQSPATPDNTTSAPAP